jgi:hypothetical protein
MLRNNTLVLEIGGKIPSFHLGIKGQGTRFGLHANWEPKWQMLILDKSEKQLRRTPFPSLWG